MMDDIIAHYNAHVDMLEMNRKLYEIWQGQLRKEVEDSLRREIISPRAYQRAIERIPSINVPKKAVDKLSKVYIENPVRLADNKVDREIMQNIVKNSDMNNCMMVGNQFLNLHWMFAAEPYVQDGIQKVRILGGHQFLPYSDDPSNPNNMTVFIKLLGNETKEVTVPKFDVNGQKQGTTDEIRQVTILALYSDDEFLIIDTGGGIRVDLMRKMGVNSAKNPFGRIPFIYGTKNKTQLVPYPNKEAYDMAILIPKLYTDLNYASQFMSHSIIWTKNAKIGNQEINPDAIVDLGERTEENGDPEIGTIDPTVDIPNTLRLIGSQLDMYFSSIGIKTEIRNNSNEDASGVAKAIDEGDTTAERKVQLEFFTNIEMRLWDLISDMQDVWSSAGIVNKERRKFTTGFSDTFRVMFAEMKPLKTFKQKMEEIQLMRAEKMITRRQALKMVFPDMTDNQLDDWEKDLDKEKEKQMEDMFMGVAPLSAERKQDGTFNEENQQGAKQQPENNLKASMGEE